MTDLKLSVHGGKGGESLALLIEISLIDVGEIKLLLLTQVFLRHSQNSISFTWLSKCRYICMLVHHENTISKPEIQGGVLGLLSDRGVTQQRYEFVGQGM